MEIHIKYIFPIFFYNSSNCIVLEQLNHTQHIQNMRIWEILAYKPKMHIRGWHVCESMSLNARFYILKYKIEKSYIININRTVNIRRLMNGSSCPF
jgi:hypothetical protein